MDRIGNVAPEARKRSMNESKNNQDLKGQPASRDQGSVAIVFPHLPVFFSVTAVSV